MTVLALQLDCARGRSRVQRCPHRRQLRVRLIAGGEIPLVDVQHPPGGRLVLGEAGGYEARQLLQRELAVVEVADVKLCDVEGVDVCVDESGEHQPAAEVLDPRLRSYPR